MSVVEIIGRCVGVIKARLPDEKWHVWLFGSQARKCATPCSDVDIAIEGDTAVPWETLAAIKNEIDEIPTLRSIDVVDARTADDRFRGQVFGHGKRLA
jgi:predicted nucleotidyltransferase